MATTTSARSSNQLPNLFLRSFKSIKDDKNCRVLLELEIRSSAVLDCCHEACTTWNTSNTSYRSRYLVIIKCSINWQRKSFLDWLSKRQIHLSWIFYKDQERTVSMVFHVLDDQLNKILLLAWPTQTKLCLSVYLILLKTLIDIKDWIEFNYLILQDIESCFEEIQAIFIKCCRQKPNLLCIS